MSNEVISAIADNGELNVGDADKRRENVCTKKEFEGLYYLDYEFLDAYYKIIRSECGLVIKRDSRYLPTTAHHLKCNGIKYDFDGTTADWVFDKRESGRNWEHMVRYVDQELRKCFKSFNSVFNWNGNKFVVVENKFFEIAAVDGDWCVAWCLLERDDIDGTARNRAIMRRYYLTYLEGIKRILVEGWGEAIGYGDAWTRGKRYTYENAA